MAGTVNVPLLFTFLSEVLPEKLENTKPLFLDGFHPQTVFIHLFISQRLRIYVFVGLSLFYLYSSSIPK